MKKRIFSLALALLLLLALPMSAFAYGHGNGHGDGQGNGGGNGIGGGGGNLPICETVDCHTSGRHNHNGVAYRGHYIGDGHDHPLACDVVGCIQCGNHNHNGQAGRYPLCELEFCNISCCHYHDGIIYSGHYTGDGHNYHQDCGLAGCELGGHHGHHGGGVNAGYPDCPFSPCDFVGAHNHNGITYKRNDYAAKFLDMSSKDNQGNATWYYEAVNTLVGMEIISGVNNTTFAPNANIKRSEFTKLLYTFAESMGKDVKQMYDIPFKDMPSNDYWATGYIGWAYNSGIVSGYNETVFAPEDNISRQDIAVMLDRFLDNYMAIELDETSTADFTDSAYISDYALGAVEFVVKRGLMQGNANGTFAPLEKTKRNQSAQILYNCLELLEAA